MSEEKIICSGYRRCKALNPNKKCRHEEPHEKIDSCTRGCGPSRTAMHKCYTMDLRGHIEYVLDQKGRDDGV